MLEPHRNPPNRTTLEVRLSTEKVAEIVFRVGAKARTHRARRASLKKTPQSGTNPIVVADPSWRSAAAPGRDPGRDQGFPRPPGGEVFQQAVFEWAPSGGVTVEMPQERRMTDGREDHSGTKVWLPSRAQTCRSSSGRSVVPNCKLAF